MRSRRSAMVVSGGLRRQDPAGPPFSQAMPRADRRRPLSHRVSDVLGARAPRSRNASALSAMNADSKGPGDEPQDQG